MGTNLTIEELQEASRTRAARWHDPDDPWTPLEWAGAMCGEAGEAANVAKKLRRLQGKIKNFDKRKDKTLYDNRTQADLELRVIDYRNEIAKEVADAILYGICLLNEIDRDAETVVRDIFNQKSEEYGFPERV